MTDKQLRTFITVSEYGSFMKAANALFITAPAVKKQIDQLEAEIAVQLFYRNNHGLQLTEDGQEFLDYSISAISSLDAELVRLKKKHAIQQHIHIGFNSTQFGDVLYINALSEYKQHHPDIEVELTESDTFDIKKFDLFLSYFSFDEQNYHRYLLNMQPLHCIIDRQHKLSQKSSLCLSDLYDQKVLLPPIKMLEMLDPSIHHYLPYFLHISHNHHEDERESYVVKCIIKKQIAIIIGKLDSLPSSLVQLPLEKYHFPYYLYAHKSMKKKHVLQYVKFLQGYYSRHANEFF